MKIYLVEYFYNEAWGQRSYDNRLSFQKAYVKKTFKEAQRLAKALAPTSERRRGLRDGVWCTLFETRDKLISVRLITL